MLSKAIGALQLYLFVLYPRADTFKRTDYLAQEQLMPPEEQKLLMEQRFAGYKAICTFGLGSLFWGSATGVLSDLQQKTGLIEYIYIHSIVTFVLMLNGLVASTFQRTAWFAPSVAGLGSWSALILFLGTAHLMSLKFHSYEKECLYSMGVSSAIVTSYWVLSVQDPLILYISVKTVLWIVGLIFYGICSILYLACLSISWILHFLLEFLWTGDESIRNRLVGACSWDYRPVPDEPEEPDLA